jgi:membrane-bound serine protease (ClpP class)
MFVLGAGLRAQKLPARVGRETMLGHIVPALTRIDSASGKVFIEGEYWNARSDSAVTQGQPVEIVGVEGLTLRVKTKT